MRDGVSSNNESIEGGGVAVDVAVTLFSFDDVFDDDVDDDDVVVVVNVVSWWESNDSNDESRMDGDVSLVSLVSLLWDSFNDELIRRFIASSYFRRPSMVSFSLRMNHHSQLKQLNRVVKRHNCT